MTEYLDTLKRYLQSSDALIVVTGNQDDKTALLSQVVVQMRITRPVICFQASKHLKPDQLLRTLSLHWLPTPYEPKLNLQSQLETFLSSLIEREQFCILMIDDAHLLPFSILAAVAHLALRQEKQVNLHIILAGNRSLLNRLKRVYTKETWQEVILNESSAWTPPPQPTTQSWSRHAVRISAIFGLIFVFAVMSWRQYDQSHLQVASADRTRSHGIINPPAEQSRQPQVIKTPLEKIQPKKVSHLLLATSSKQKSSLVSVHQSTLSPGANQLERYTLQLMGRNNQQDLEKFVAMNHLMNTQIVHTEYQNKDWYILVYGHYATDTQANAAMRNLSPFLKQLHPWIRPIKTVHLVLNNST